MQLRLFRHFVPVSVVLLVSSDALLITGAFYQMLSQTSGIAQLNFGVSSFPAQFSAGLSVAAIAAMVAVGLYGQQAFVDFRVLISRIAVAFVLVLMLLLVATSYWREGLRQLPDARNLPLKATLIWLGCITLTRGTFLVTLGRGLLKRRIVVLGNGTQAARIAGLVEAGENQHFVPVSFVRMPGERGSAGADMLDWAAEDPDSLADLGYRVCASEIVVATDDRRGLPVRQLLHCKLTGIKVTDFLDFWERETRTVDLEALRPSWLFYSDGFRCGVVDKLLKRAFDIMVSLALLVFSLPLLAATACLIKLDSRGPILYRQERVGVRGQAFTISEIPQHADRRRAGRQPQMGGERRSPGHPRRGDHPQIAHRRTRADPECAARRYELCRAAPGAALFRRQPRRGHSLLLRAPLGAARHHRLGADQLSLWRLDRGRAAQAVL